MSRSISITERLTTAYPPNGPVAACRARLRLYHRRHRTRQQLSRLDDGRLADLGLSEADRARERQKWFWQE